LLTDASETLVKELKVEKKIILTNITGALANICLRIKAYIQGLNFFLKRLIIKDGESVCR